MYKIIYKVSHENKKAELHFVVEKGRIEEFNVITEDEDLKFSLEVLLERDVNFIATLKRNNIFGKVKLYINVPPNVEEFLYILSSILAWHGYKVEEVLSMKKKETLKSIKLLDIEDIVVDALEEKGDDSVILLNGRLDVDEKVLNKSTKELSRIILKSSSYKNPDSSQFEWEQDENGEYVLKGNKVPAGWVARNKNTGKILVGGQFIGKIYKKDYDEGKIDWEFYKAIDNSTPLNERQKRLGELAKGESLDTRKVLELLPFILSSLKVNPTEEGLDSQQILNIFNKFLEKVLPEDKRKQVLEKIEDALRLATTTQAQNVQAQKKITKPLSNLLDIGRQYYVYDAKRGLIVDYPTYLVNKDEFSNEVYFLNDDISNARARALAGSMQLPATKRDEKEARVLEEAVQERIRKTLEKIKPDIDSQKVLAELTPFIKEINSNAYRTGKGVPEYLIENTKRILEREGIKLPLTIFDVNSMHLLRVRPEIRDLFYLPDDPDMPPDLYNLISSDEIKTRVPIDQDNLALPTIYRHEGSGYIHPVYRLTEEDSELDEIPIPGETRTVSSDEITDLELQITMQKIDEDFRSKTKTEEQKLQGKSAPYDYSIMYSAEDLEEFYKKVGLSEAEYKKYLYDEHGNPNPRYYTSLGYKIPIELVPRILEHYGISVPNNFLDYFKKDNEDSEVPFALYPHQLKAVIKGLIDKYDYHTFVNGQYVRNENGHRLGMFFAHYTGTGKTITGLTLIRAREAITGDTRPTLLIVPNTIDKNWIKDFEVVYGYEPTVSSEDVENADIVKIDGTPEQREATYIKLMDLFAKREKAIQEGAEKIPKLPKLIILKTSTTQRATRENFYGEPFSEDTFTLTSMDRYYLELFGMGGRLVYRDQGKEHTIVTKQGLLSNIFVDEASMIFSEDSQRRKTIEAIARAVTSDRGRGHAWFLNATVLANDANDISSMISLIHADPHIGKLFRPIDQPKKGGAFTTRSMPRLDLKRLQAISQFTDIVGFRHLNPSNVTVNRKVKPVFGNVDLYAPVRHQKNFSFIMNEVTGNFLKLAALDRAEVEVSGNVYNVLGPDKTVVSEAIPNAADVRAKEDLYGPYLPGLISLVKDAVSGTFAWRRMWEYGILSTGENEPQPFRIKDPITGKETNVDLEGAVISASIEAFTKDPELLQAIQFYSGPIKRQNNFITIAKQLKETTDPKQRSQLMDDFRREIEVFSHIYDQVQQLTRTFGLSSFEMRFDEQHNIDISSSLGEGFRKIAEKAREILSDSDDDLDNDYDKASNILKEILGNSDEVFRDIENIDEIIEEINERIQQKPEEESEIDSNTDLGLSSSSQNSSSGQKVLLGSRPLYFPGYGHNWEEKKVDVFEEEEGTAVEDITGLAEGTGSAGHTGSERKVTIEYRDRLKNLALVLALSQYLTGVNPSEGDVAFPVLIYDKDRDNFDIKIFEGRFPNSPKNISRQYMNPNADPVARISEGKHSSNPVVQRLATLGVIDANSSFKRKHETLYAAVTAAGRKEYRYLDIGRDIGNVIDSFATQSSAYAPAVLDGVASAAATLFENSTAKIGLSATSRHLADATDFILSNARNLRKEYPSLYKALKAKVEEKLTNKKGVQVTLSDHEFENLLSKMNFAYKYGEKGKYINKDTPEQDRQSIVDAHNKLGSSITLVTSAGSRGLNLPSDAAYTIASSFSRELIFQILGRWFRIANKDQKTVDMEVGLIPMVFEVLKLKDFLADEVFDPSILSLDPTHPDYAAAQQRVAQLQDELQRLNKNREESMDARVALMMLATHAVLSGKAQPNPVDMSFGIKKSINVIGNNINKELKNAIIKDLIIIPAKFIVK